MKPIAVPTVGGMVTATLTNLVLIPVLFYWVNKKNTQGGLPGKGQGKVLIQSS
jgi:Cu/Ag efflux pump CusA